LWEVEGISNHVYLLGSIHVLREGDSLPQGVVDAYGSADVLIMEMDLDKVDPMATAQITQQLGIDPQGKTLDELLGPADYASASRKASADFGVEQQLIHKAHDDHKEIRGLETMEEQLGALAGLSPRAQRAFLMQTLDEAKSIDNEVEEIVSAWRTGNTQVLEKDFLKDLRDQPELYQRIVVQRNRNWIRQITALTRERRNYLVIVGTMHLVGRDSLLQMLAGAGVRTHQIQAKH
jgi:uncharacterized protein YbaP (TraB family)